MSWYYILFTVVFCFFLIKTIISWIFGDIDIDFDLDGDVDFDISSMFSFKGILHFLLGFSAYLSLIATFNEVGNETYHFSIIHYLIAIFVGIIFTITLFYLYNLMMKLNHSNDNIISLNNYTATVLINNGYDTTNNLTIYTVNILTETGIRKINVYSEKPNLKIGENYKIYVDEKNRYCI